MSAGESERMTREVAADGLYERAVNGLIEAMELVETEGDERTKEIERAKISRVQVRLTGEVTYDPDYFLALGTGWEGMAKNELYEQVALLLVETGDLSRGREVANETYVTARFGAEMARAVARKGGDPREWLARVYQGMREGDAGDVGLAGELLEVGKELGLEVDASILDRLGRHNGSDEEYADFLQMELARAYAKVGLIERAMEMWWGTKENGRLQKTETLATIAVAMAKQGNEINEVVAVVEAQVGLVGDEKGAASGLRKVDVYARAIEAVALAGGETSGLVEKARKTCLTEEGNLRAEAYLALGRGMLRGGLDRAREMLILARMVVDEGNETIPEDDWIARVEWALIREDVFEELAKGGYYDDARETLERLGTDPEIWSQRASFTALLAEAEWVGAGGRGSESIRASVI